jgi:hypothetical protein
MSMFFSKSDAKLLDNTVILKSKSLKSYSSAKNLLAISPTSGLASL